MMVVDIMMSPNSRWASACVRVGYSTAFTASPRTPKSFILDTFWCPAPKRDTTS